ALSGTRQRRGIDTDDRPAEQDFRGIEREAEAAAYFEAAPNWFLCQPGDRFDQGVDRGALFDIIFDPPQILGRFRIIEAFEIAPKARAAWATDQVGAMGDRQFVVFRIGCAADRTGRGERFPAIPLNHSDRPRLTRSRIRTN